MRSRDRPFLIFSLAVSLVTTASPAVWLCAGAAPSSTLAQSLYPVHWQRFGVSVARHWGYGIEDYSVGLLRPGWYTNWAWSAGRRRWPR